MGGVVKADVVLEEDDDDEAKNAVVAKATLCRLFRRPPHPLLLILIHRSWLMVICIYCKVHQKEITLVMYCIVNTSVVEYALRMLVGEFVRLMSWLIHEHAYSSSCLAYSRSASTKR